MSLSEVLTFALVSFTAILFVVDPFAALPIFLTITGNDTPAQRKQTAFRASVAAFVTLTVFAVAGGFIFKVFGISLGAFKIAGGIMLLLMAIDMMRAQPSRTRSSVEEQEESAVKEDKAIVPLAIPMLAGPGAIATAMVLMSRAAWEPMSTLVVLASILATCAITWLVLRSAAMAQRFLKRTTLHVMERVMGLLLAAVAVEFVLGGLRDVFPSLK
jgi:multiple antibiotic resistance protein